MIITKTPFRLSFFGGGTDYRPWFQEHGGLIIAAAISRYCYISLRPLPPFFEHKTRVVYSHIESVNSHTEIRHPSIKHCLEFMKTHAGLEVHHDGDLPARSGIGSSSSFTVGFLNALHALKYELVTQKTLADEAIHVEQNLIQENVGIQDQIMAAYGGLRVIEMGPGDQYRVLPLFLPPDYFKALEEHVLLAFSGVSRLATVYAQKQIENIQTGKTQGELQDMLGIAREALEMFRRQECLSEIGRLLDRSWQLKKRLASDLSNSGIDEVYETARKAGAYGGKLMGAGGGGFIMFLAPPYKHEAIRKALTAIKVWVPFKIDMDGSHVLLHNDDEWEDSWNA